MSKESPTRDVVFARLFRDVITQVNGEIRHIDSDLSQAAVWIVGLASAVLIAAVANAEARRVIGDDLKRVVFLVWVSVISGVTHRLLGLWMSSKMGPHLMSLYSVMAGYAAGFETRWYPELSECWNVDEIVSKLKDLFDYEHPRGVEPTLENSRSAYVSLRDSYLKSEEEAVSKHNALLAAYFGAPRPELVSRDAADQRWRLIRRLNKARNIVFAICSLTFVSALCLLALALWRVAENPITVLPHIGSLWD